MTWLTLLLTIFSTLGVLTVLLQRLLVGRALRRPATAPTRTPGFSILKPLCGVDDELEQNLACFAHLDWPEYEVLLGVKDVRDSAFPVALAAAARWPDRFRVVLQQGSPGLNPKVNQLATLERRARHDLLVISDSNARVGPGYLTELAALFERPSVACVTSPVSGVGHMSFGALLDNLHLAADIGSGMVAAKVAGKSLVVGKSMALTRAALEQLGGFTAFADVLAEDYVIGQAVEQELGLEVAVAQQPVLNVAVNRTVGAFAKRYMRWSVIHRSVLTFPTFLAQLLTNPWPLALLAAALSPNRFTLAFAAAVFVARALIDLSAAKRMGCGPLGLRAVAAVGVKDVLIFVAWLNALVVRTVDWRGNRLRVTRGSRLLLPEAPATEELSGEPEPAPEAVR